MAEAVYILCAVTSALCAVLLLRNYRRNRTRLLLWTSLCFGLLAANNLLLVIDLIFFPQVDLAIARSMTAVGAGMVLLLGLIWEAQ
jgi:hypothetical protein